MTRAGRVASLPASFPCGTRSAYVRGCRCDACRCANRTWARERLAARKAVDVVPNGPPVAFEKNGRTYQIGCPGVLGEPCRVRAFLRRDTSLGGVCRICRARATFGGLVSAAPAKRHLEKLARLGVGSRAVSAASDVALSVTTATTGCDAALS